MPELYFSRAVEIALLNNAQIAEVRDALLKTDHQGVLGPFRFTAHRDPASAEGVVVLAVKDGKFDTLE